jgi:hypothetical protein
VLIKCVGFELNEGNERLLGRSRMHPTNVLGDNLWIQIEAHFDSKTFSSPFGSSYLNAVGFNAKVMLRCWQEPELLSRLQRSELGTVRINTLSASEGMRGLELADPRVSSMLTEHVASTAATFNSTMSIAAYVAWNVEQWDLLHGILRSNLSSSLGTSQQHAMTYPFRALLKELRRELPGDSASVDVSSGGSVPVANREGPSARGGEWLHLQGGETREARQLRVVQQVSALVGGCTVLLTDVDADTALAEASLDSIAAVEVIGKLREATGLPDLTPAVLLSPGVTIRDIAAHLMELDDQEADPGQCSEEKQPCSVRALTPMSGSVALGAAPRPPLLAGRVLIVLSMPDSATDVLVEHFGGLRDVVPFELHLLPYATMEERSAHLAASGHSTDDPLWRAFSELRGSSIEDSRRFIDEEFGVSCPTWRVYDALMALCHPRILVDLTSSTSSHISIACRALQMFQTPRILCVVRDPLICVVEAARRELHLSHSSGRGQVIFQDGGGLGKRQSELESMWLQATATMLEFIEEARCSLPDSHVTTVHLEDIQGKDAAETIGSLFGGGEAAANKGPAEATHALPSLMMIPQQSAAKVLHRALGAVVLGATLLRLRRKGAAATRAATLIGLIALLLSIIRTRWRRHKPAGTAGNNSTSIPVVDPPQSAAAAASEPAVAVDQRDDSSDSSPPSVVVSPNSSVEELSAEDDASSLEGLQENQPLPDIDFVQTTASVLGLSPNSSFSDASNRDGVDLSTSLAVPLASLQSTTKLMARQLGYSLPAELPAGCFWMRTPSPGTERQPTVLFSGILGGPLLFGELAARIPCDGGGLIAIDYSTGLVDGCDSWQALVRLYTDIVRQTLVKSGPARLLGYSFGCRVAYAVSSLLEVEQHEVELMLLDGPIGGGRGSLEGAMLSANARDGASSNSGSSSSAGLGGSTGEMATAMQLVFLLSRGGEETPEPLGRRARVMLFVASDDEVGLDMANEHLRIDVIHRVRGSHRALLGTSGVHSICTLIRKAFSRHRTDENKGEGRRHHET